MMELRKLLNDLRLPLSLLILVSNLSYLIDNVG